MTDLHPDHAPAIEAKMTINRALEKLTMPERRIMILRFYEEMSFPDIAQNMGITLAQARTLYRSTAAKMKRIVRGVDKPKK